MLASKIEQIIQRQEFIDNISEGQIQTLKVKQIFYKASEECLKFISPFQKVQNQQNVFNSPHLDDCITSLLKGILPPQQNSYEEIQQIENRLKILNDDQFNQIQIIKKSLKSQKEDIMNSELTVKDLTDIYESDILGQKQINDPLIKKIITLFQTNAKQCSLYDLLSMIVNQFSSSNSQVVQQSEILSKKQQIRRLRQSICSLQGLNTQKQKLNEPEFNQEIKKEMDKLLAYYLNVQRLFSQED